MKSLNALRTALCIGSAGLLCLGLSTCGSQNGNSSNASSAGASANTTVTISAADGETWPCDFNPFSPNDYFFSLGLVNEELYFVDHLNSKMTPWLATSFRWSNHDKTLAWTIRKGVKFTNGDPLTAADVAYTFNLIKKHPALDINAIYPQLLSTTQTGRYSVVMKFKSPAVANDFWPIADQVSIVPKQVWSKVANPVTYRDMHPIGTGPYTVQSCTPHNISYVKNPHYWKPGLPKVTRVEVPAYLTNTPANEALANGSAQWGNQSIPDIKRFYLARNKSNRVWAPIGGIHGIFINLTNPLLSNLAVRKAMAYGINRPRVAQIGESGELPPANQAGVPVPMFKAWYNTSLAAKYNYHYDPSKAISILKGAGFKRGSNGIFKSPSGQPLDFSLIDVGAYTNLVSDNHIIASELARIGIKINQENLSTPAYSTDVANGKFDLAYGGVGPTTVDGPYNILRVLLYSGNTAPIGKPAASNYERYRSATEDALLNRMSATTNVAQEHQLMKQIEVPMLTDVPFIPVTDAAGQTEYNVAFASGWPTPSNPYADPSPTTQPDEEVVLLHLVPKG